MGRALAMGTVEVPAVGVAGSALVAGTLYLGLFSLG